MEAGTNVGKATEFDHHNEEVSDPVPRCYGTLCCGSNGNEPVNVLLADCIAALLRGGDSNKLKLSALMEIPQ